MKKSSLILLMMLLASVSFNIGCEKTEDSTDIKILSPPAEKKEPQQILTESKPGKHDDMTPMGQTLGKKYDFKELPGEIQEKAIEKPLPTATPAPYPQNLDEIVQAELKKLSPGRILFNVPHEMRQGVTEKVEARLTKAITEDLSKGLKGKGVPQIEDIKLNTLMSVRLNGDKDSFDIKSLSHEDQIVEGEGFTQWEWDVTPLKFGGQSLSLTVTIRMKMPTYGEERKDYPVFEKQISVMVNPWHIVCKFVEDYWQFIITAMLVPIIGWFVNKRRKSQKKD